MPLTKKDRTETPEPMSFRFPPDTALKLRVLAEYTERSASKVLGILIQDEYERLQKLESKEIATTERKVRRQSQD